MAADSSVCRDKYLSIAQAKKHVNEGGSLRDVAEKYLKTLKPGAREIVEEIMNNLEIEFDLPITIKLGNAQVEIAKYDSYYLNYVLEALLYRAGVAEKLGEKLGYVNFVLTSIVREFLENNVRRNESKNTGIALKITRISEREELYYKIVTSILSRHVIKTFYMTTTNKEYEIGMFCFDKIAYTPCEKDIVAEIEELVSKTENVDKKTTRWIINEAIAKIKRKTLTKLRYEPLKIAFKNYVLDWEKFLKTGSIRDSVQVPGPEIIVFHVIPHELALEKLERAVQKLNGLVKFDESMITNVENIERIAEELCPKSLKAFKDWVGEKWILLFEIIGYTLYPKHDLHKAVMLLGSGSNGKSTYLRLIRDILGPQNVSSISLQDLCDENKRFIVAELYHKLANIYPDLPSHALKHTGRFKALTGEDEITADRKFKDPISFVNYAKLLFSANELPPVSDMTPAFWRRWIVIEFPNQFPLNPRFYEETFTEQEKEGIIIVSLFAFRNAWIRRRFSFEETEVDYKEKWLRNVNTVYAFIKDLLQGKVEGYRAERNPSARIEASKLYNIYVNYCNNEDIEPVDKRRFTIEMERLGYRKTVIKGKRYYRGLRVIKEREEVLVSIVH